MKSSFYHIKINVSNPDFYKILTNYLGFRTVVEYANGFGASDGKVSLWVFKTSSKNTKPFNYQATGLNHLAFRVETKAEVDKFYEGFLLKNKINVLHKPAEHYQYNTGKGYYAVFFEDSDRIKLEVAWVAE